MSIKNHSRSKAGQAPQDSPLSKPPRHARVTSAAKSTTPEKGLPPDFPDLTEADVRQILEATAERVAAVQHSNSLALSLGFVLGPAPTKYLDLARCIAEALRELQEPTHSGVDPLVLSLARATKLLSARTGLDAVEADKSVPRPEARVLSEIVNSAVMAALMPMTEAEKRATFGKLASQAATIAESLKQLHPDPNSAYEEVGRGKVTEEDSTHQQSAHNPQAKRRARGGYVQPNRVGKKLLGVHVDEGLARAFRAAVEAEGLTVQDKITAFMLDTVAKKSDSRDAAVRRKLALLEQQVLLRTLAQQLKTKII